jgi:PAS domain-containing protein
VATADQRPSDQVPGHAGTANWLLASFGLAATALLGALLLTVTGQHRRTQLAVTTATSDLRREMGERQSAELAARESEARLRSILDHAPLGVVFLDPAARSWKPTVPWRDGRASSAEACAAGP